MLRRRRGPTGPDRVAGTPRRSESKSKRQQPAHPTADAEQMEHVGDEMDIAAAARGCTAVTNPCDAGQHAACEHEQRVLRRPPLTPRQRQENDSESSENGANVPV